MHSDWALVLIQETAKKNSGASQNSGQAKNSPDISDMAMNGGQKVHRVLDTVPTAAATSLKTSTSVRI